jgi:hypothetical protein
MFLVALGEIEPPTQGFSTLRAASATKPLVYRTGVLLFNTTPNPLTHRVAAPLAHKLCQKLPISNTSVYSRQPNSYII